MPRKSKPAPEAMQDPLLAATVGKLPKPGTVWEEHQRVAWFDLMRKAVAMTYELPEQINASGIAVNGASPAKPSKYWIAPDGTAIADGKMIDANQIPMNTIVLDYRPLPAAGKWDDDLNPIMWLTQGAKVMRPPSGVKLRPADGPLPTVQANGSAEAEA